MHRLSAVIVQEQYRHSHCAQSESSTQNVGPRIFFYCHYVTELEKKYKVSSCLSDIARLKKQKLWGPTFWVELSD